jgi:hypothetical protein
MSARDAVRSNLNALDMMPACVCGDLSPIGATVCESCGRALVNAPKRVTHKQRLLNLLDDGKPHSHLECYGLHIIAHSRVADLRADGYDISQWRDGDLYWYRLNASPIRTDEPGDSPSLVPVATTTVLSQFGGDALSGTGCNDSLQAVVPEGPGTAQLSLAGSEFRRREP